MVQTLPKLDSRRADFGDLRDAYQILGDVLDLGGMIEKRGRGLYVTRISREIGSSFEAKMKGKSEALRALIDGLGEKKSLEGKEEVVLSVIADPSGSHDFDICALRIQGRGPIIDAIKLSTRMPDWQSKIRGFADWEKIAGIICAADGNNQRASIGAILTLAAIGRGMIPMIEMEVPQEIDESTHLVRGAEWMKAGLPRFESAASEALWYLIRARSLHSRMFKERKQGFYTAMALVAFVASGVTFEEISDKTHLPVSLVKKLGEPAEGKPLIKADIEFIKSFIYDGCEDFLKEDRAQHAAERIWRGSAIYLRGMDWRLRISKQARTALGAGEDLVTVSENLRIQRRELVRILSQALGDSQKERDRFRAAIPRPEAFRSLIL
jgi:hypothetical protein